jgi:hypothetical protein
MLIKPSRKKLLFLNYEARISLVTKTVKQVFIISSEWPDCNGMSCGHPLERIPEKNG